MDAPRSAGRYMSQRPATVRCGFSRCSTATSSSIPAGVRPEKPTARAHSTRLSRGCACATATRATNRCYPSRPGVDTRPSPALPAAAARMVQVFDVRPKQGDVFQCGGTLIAPARMLTWCRCHPAGEDHPLGTQRLLHRPRRSPDRGAVRGRLEVRRPRQPAPLTTPAPGTPCRVRHQAAHDQAADQRPAS